MSVYLDASFLVSLYSADANSTAAVDAMQALDEVLLVTQLAELEVVNSFELRIFRRDVTALQAATSWQNFAVDLRAGLFRLQRIPSTSFVRAQQISRQNTAKLGTRTADLLHVAAALELGCDWLYSFDVRQRELAESLKLKLNSHT